MNLFELVVVGCIGDRRKVKNRVELFIAELLAPIERGEVLRNEISTISSEVLEIAGPEIVNHCEPRVRKFLLQREREIRADEPGAAGDDEVGRMVSRGHRQICCALIK